MQKAQRNGHGRTTDRLWSYLDGREPGDNVVYVRPLLEHNAVIWSPYIYTVKDIEAIEQVQRRFTKRLRGYGNYSYPERLYAILNCIA